MVPWSSLHLTSRRGHKVQLSSRSARLAELPLEDLVHLLTRLSASHAGDVARAAPTATVGDALQLADDEVASRLLDELDETAVHQVLEALPAARARTLRRSARRPRPRRRYHRTRGWKRRAPRERVSPG